MKVLKYEDEISLLFLENEKELVKELKKEKKDSVKKANSELIRTSDDFTGTKTFEEAEKLRVEGCYPLFQNIQKKIEKNSLTVNHKKDRVITTNQLKGFYPNVARALMNHPKSMIQTKKTTKDSLVVNLFVGVSFDKNDSMDSITTFGSLLLALVDKLEAENIRVNLFTLEAHLDTTEKTFKKYSFETVSLSTHKKIFNIPYKSNIKIKEMIEENVTLSSPELEDCSVDGSILNIKRADEPLNMLKLSYYLSHPSFLRRHLFKLQENSEHLKDLTKNLYGVAHVLAYAKAEFLINQYFHKPIVITNYFFPHFSNESLFNENLNEAYLLVKKVLNE